jgi:hypothetical protein
MKDPSQILRESAETYQKKNADYGESWRAIGEILHGLTKGKPVVLETPDDFVSFGLFTRRMDKLARCFNGEFLSDNLNFESIADSHSDEAAYAAIHAALLGEQESIEYVRDEDIEAATLRVDDEPAGRMLDFFIEHTHDEAYQAKYEELVADE